MVVVVVSDTVDAADTTVEAAVLAAVMLPPLTDPPLDCPLL